MMTVRLVACHRPQRTKFEVVCNIQMILVRLLLQGKLKLQTSKLG